MSLLSVSEAQQRLLALAPEIGTELAQLQESFGRWLAADVTALRDQPWTDLSAMDGYAIRFADLPGPWRVVGESAAGGQAPGMIAPGQAMRIFTGAAMPHGADCVLVQEEAKRDGDLLELAGEGPGGPGKHVRPLGSDFAKGQRLLPAGTRLGAPQISLAAIAGHGALPVRRKIRVALFSTGNELVEPGKQTRPDQLPASNGIMLRAMLKGLPVLIDDLGILPDDMAAQTAAFRRAASADIVVTTGGASVGDHDLVKPAFEAAGGAVDFWRIALRPGKPLMAGRNDDAMFLGLPGNPVSAFVTATLFLLPLVRHLAGCPDPLPPVGSAPLAQDMPAVAARAQYIRATLTDGKIAPLSDQDSAAMLSLSTATALLIRPAGAGAARAGEGAEYIPLD